MNLFVKKLNEKAVLPARATEFSAGYDLSACLDEPIIVKSGEIVKIPTGICVAPSQNDVVLLIYARSSLATKFGVTLANCVGVVDSDYRGEILVALINQGKDDYIINHGERIAQLVVTPILSPEIIETTELSDTERGVGGFGSTGK